MEIKEAVEMAAEVFNTIEKDREIAIISSRKIIRASKTVIHKLHNNEEYQNDLNILISLSQNISTDCQPALDALSEYAEAVILISIVKNKNVPSFIDLKIPAGCWILGMADAIGELRRIVLNCLISNDFVEANEYFQWMERMYESLSLLDVPDAILPIRRKQDIARSVLEKTRADLFLGKMRKMGD